MINSLSSKKNTTDDSSVVFFHVKVAFVSIKKSKGIDFLFENPWFVIYEYT